MGTLFTRIRFAAGALALAFIVAWAAPVGAQQRNPDNSVNPTASCGQRGPAAQGVRPDFRPLHAA